MEKKIQKFIEPVKKVSLSVQEKSDLRNRILLEMNQPILISAPNIFERTRILFGSFRPAYAMALLLVFVLSGGISFAAEGALPGNLLYPVKVKINEKISGIFVVGSLNKAERESQLIDKRLEEVKVLAKSGELSNKNIKIVEDQISIHAENSKGHIVALEAEKDFEGALSVQAKLKSSLTVNEKIITEAGEKNKNITSIVLQAKEELLKVSDKKDSLEKTLTKEPGFDIGTISEIKRKSAKLALLAAEEFVKGEGKDLGQDKDAVSSPAAEMKSSQVFVSSANFALEEDPLNLIAEKIKAGEAHLAAREYDKAIKLFEEAYQASRDLVLYPEEIKNQEKPQDKIEVNLEEGKEPVLINQDEPLQSKEENLTNLEKEKSESKPEVKGESVMKTDLKEKSSIKMEVESKSKVKSKAPADVFVNLPVETQ